MGKIEVETPAGRIDVLTNTEIIEIKRAIKWKEAIGQILADSTYHPSKQKRIHLFGKLPKNSFEEIYNLCLEKNIKLTYEMF